MPIEGFDYKAFSSDLANQAQAELTKQGSNAAPEFLSDNDKKNIVETVRKYCFMAGEALSNDNQIKFNADQASLVTQFIGEWTFHKSIDLIHGKVPVQNRDSILQIVAANIFNTAKLAIIKKMPTETIINLVEAKVNQIYTEELKKLVKKGVFSQKQFENASNVSNLKDMVQKTEDEVKLQKASSTVEVKNPSQSDKKVLKLAALAIVLKKLPQEKAEEILRSLDKNDVVHVLNYMKLKDIENKIDQKLIIKSLNEIKNILPDSGIINVSKLLKNHYRLLETTSLKTLKKIAQHERETVRDFILDTSFPAEEIFSPLVIQSLVKTVEEKINDN